MDNLLDRVWQALSDARSPLYAVYRDLRAASARLEGQELHGDAVRQANELGEATTLVANTLDCINKAIERGLKEHTNV